MWFAFQILMLFIAGFALVIWIEAKRPNHDNATLYVIIFGFITTNVGVLIAKGMGDKNQETLNKQNVVLDEVRDKVNGGTQAAMQAMKDEHDAAMKKLAEEYRVHRHDFKDEINLLNLQKTEVETKLVEATAQLTKADERNKELVRELAKCAESLGRTKNEK